MPALTLISFPLCPYVQRAAIVLAEKGVAFERIDIDLANKPDWFLAISPLGRVPVLRVGETVLFESAVIAEYLEETNAPALHPADPLEKARHRAWIELGASMLSDLWTVETTADAKAFDAAVAALRTKLGRVEAVLGEAPFFAGARFSLVDAAFAPVFRYFDLFGRAPAFARLEIMDGLPKCVAWARALAARQSVIGAVAPDFAERLRAFVRAQNGRLAAMLDA